MLTITSKQVGTYSQPRLPSLSPAARCKQYGAWRVPEQTQRHPPPVRNKYAYTPFIQSFSHCRTGSKKHVKFASASRKTDHSLRFIRHRLIVLVTAHVDLATAALFLECRQDWKHHPRCRTIASNPSDDQWPASRTRPGHR